MDLCLTVLKESNKRKLSSTATVSISNSVLIISHDYYLSGLSHAHFSPTTFLKIAVYIEDITWRRGDTKFLFEC